jgi:hypothetical protein
MGSAAARAGTKRVTHACRCRAARPQSRPRGPQPQLQTGNAPPPMGSQHMRRSTPRAKNSKLTPWLNTPRTGLSAHDRHALGQVVCPQIFGAFQDLSRSTHFVSGRAALETLPTGQSMYMHDARRCVAGSAEPAAQVVMPSQAAFRWSASRSPTELNPYACDLRFHRLLVSHKRYKCWSGHDHLVSEGGVEPLAYITAAGTDPWLSV